MAKNPKSSPTTPTTTTSENKNDLGYSAGCSSPDVTNNYFVGGQALDVNNCSSLTITGNTFYGSTLGLLPVVLPEQHLLRLQPAHGHQGLRPPQRLRGRPRPHRRLQLGPESDGGRGPSVGPLARVPRTPSRTRRTRSRRRSLSGTYDGGPGLGPHDRPDARHARRAFRRRPPTGPEFKVFILTSTPGPYEFFDVPPSAHVPRRDSRARGKRHHRGLRRTATSVRTTP